MKMIDYLRGAVESCDRQLHLPTGTITKHAINMLQLYDCFCYFNENISYLIFSAYNALRDEISDCYML